MKKVSSLNISSFEAAENSQCKSLAKFSLALHVTSFSLSVLLLTIAENQSAHENSNSYCKMQNSPKKMVFWGFNRILTHGLCVCAAVLYQLAIGKVWWTGENHPLYTLQYTWWLVLILINYSAGQSWLAAGQSVHKWIWIHRFLQVPWKGGTPSPSPPPPIMDYMEAPSQKGTLFRLGVYKRVGISWVEL